MRRAMGAIRVRVVGRSVICPYFAFSRISVSRQRFVFDIGRVSTRRTVSPAPASLRSSCAWYIFEVRITFS